MAGQKPGPKPRPHLQVVKEGNPGKRPVNPGPRLPVTAPPEPDWREVFPPLKPMTAKRRKELEQLARSDDEVDAWDALEELKARKQAEINAAASARAREMARAEWRRVVPVLLQLGTISKIDGSVLEDLCVTRARIDMCERDISVNGVWVMGERGAQKNPAVTAVNQYRTQMKFYIAELGLSPSSRSRLTAEGSEDDEEDGIFDT